MKHLHEEVRVHISDEARFQALENKVDEIGEEQQVIKATLQTVVENQEQDRREFSWDLQNLRDQVKTLRRDRCNQSLDKVKGFLVIFLLFVLIMFIIYLSVTQVHKNGVIGA